MSARPVPDMDKKIEDALSFITAGNSVRKSCERAGIEAPTFLKHVDGEQYARARDACADAQFDEMADLEKRCLGIELKEGDEPLDDLPLELPDEKDLPTFPAIPRNTIMLRTPGRRDLSGSPAKAGFKPILVMILSICLPVFDMPTINISQGITPGPDGMKPIADTSSFKNTTLNIIIRHILASILTQPLKISSVFLLPPMEKARGDRTVRTTMITYRSPIWKNILII